MFFLHLHVNAMREQETRATIGGFHQTSGTNQTVPHAVLIGSDFLKTLS